MKLSEGQYSIVHSAIIQHIIPHYDSLGAAEQAEIARQTSAWLKPVLEALSQDVTPETLNRHSPFFTEVAENFMLLEISNEIGNLVGMENVPPDDLLRPLLDSTIINLLASQLFTWVAVGLDALRAEEESIPTISEILANIKEVDYSAELRKLLEEEGS